MSRLMPSLYNIGRVYNFHLFHRKFLWRPCCLCHTRPPLFSLYIIFNINQKSFVHFDTASATFHECQLCVRSTGGHDTYIPKGRQLTYSQLFHSHFANFMDCLYQRTTFFGSRFFCVMKRPSQANFSLHFFVYRFILKENLKIELAVEFNAKCCFCTY